MDDPFGGTGVNGGVSKAQQVAAVINATLDDFLRLNAAGNEFRERAQFSVLGYSGSSVRSAFAKPLGDRDFVTLGDLYQFPLRQDTSVQQRRGPEGETIETRRQVNVWVEPVFQGTTPMCAAFRRATELVTKWAAAHQESYPPVIINITDGLATDGNISDAARPLLNVATNDGKLLLFNCHISKRQQSANEFPRNEKSLPDIKDADTLFWVSSAIPTTARTAFERAAGRRLEEGTRAYIFNGDALSVRKMLTFGTTAASGPDLRD